VNLKFVVNDYVLIWNLLFQASISENIHKLKQKLWLNYKEEYNCTYKDKNLILKDPKNYIPNDDTIYNIVMETKEYEKIKKSTDKYRNEILKIWDDNKKQINKELKDILRFDIDSYNIFVVNDSLNVVDSTLIKDNKQSTLIFGKRIDTEDRNKIIVDLIFEIVKREMKDYNPKYKEIVQSVLELAILNELSTRLNDRSAYLTGEATLDYLKRQIYPYWLMYLGSAKEEMLDYMMRDKIAFEIDKYTFERQLKNVDLKEFIDFCIRNQKHIIKIKEIEII